MIWNKNKEVNDCFLKIAYEVLKRQSLLIVAPDPDSIRDSIDNYGADILTGIILFFIIGSEFFITYKVSLRKGKKEA